MSANIDGLLVELRQAIAALYGADEQQRRAADAHLKTARTQDGFWVLALRLLTSASASQQDQFFAAHALRRAAQRSRDLVEPDAGQALAEQLARLTVEAAAGQHWAIANQLAGALAELAVRAPWWAVGSLVHDLLHLLRAAQLCQQGQDHQQQQQQQEGFGLGACGQPGVLRAALVVLAALPEACQSREVSLHPERRAAAAAALASSPAIVPVLEAALLWQGPPAGAGPTPACQLAALQVIQAWSALPGAAAALQLPPGLVAGLHQAVLSSPGVATQAAEAVAALYSSCATAPRQPASQVLIQQLLLHLEGTVQTALHTAAMGGEAQRQLLNAAVTILAAAAAALAAQLRECSGAAAAGSGTNSQAPSSHKQAQEQAALSQQSSQQEPGPSEALLWEALGFVAGCLLQLLQHSDPELALSSLQVWDECLLPQLEQLAGSHQAPGQPVRVQRARQLVEQLCSGLLQRAVLPTGLKRSEATADARDLPDAVRTVRREVSDTLRAAASVLGPEQAVEQLLELAAQAHASWRAGGDPSQGWQQLECALYALNLLLPRQLAQQHGCANGGCQGQGLHATRRALALCLGALDAAAPKLAGMALTLVGGVPDALVGLTGIQPQHSSTAGPHTAGQAANGGSSSNPAGSSGGSSSNPAGSSGGSGSGIPGSLLADLLAALLRLLECPDEKLSRNAATTAHRLCNNPWLAEEIAAQHAAWAESMAGLYWRRGGTQHDPSYGDDLSTEEYLLLALCHLSRASSAGPAAAAAECGLPNLVQQLLKQAAAEAGAALSQLLQLAAAWQQQAQQQEAQEQQAAAAVANQAAAAAAQRCRVQLEMIGSILESGLPPNVSPLALEQPLEEVWAVLQGALRVVTYPVAACPGYCIGSDPLLHPLLHGCCRAVAAAVGAAPRVPVLQSALALLAPLAAGEAEPEPCVLDALGALVGGAAAAACQQQHAAAAETLLPGLGQALTAALRSSASHADDPDVAVAALRLGAAVTGKLPWSLLAPGGDELLQQLLCLVRLGAQSYHREVCEATLGLAAGLCCSSAAAVASPQAAGPSQAAAQQMGQPSAEGSVGPHVVLWLLLAASGGMPPYMIEPIAKGLHTVWGSVGSDRFSGWMSQAVLQLAPADAPWRGWKAEAVHGALADLLSPKCQQDGKRFKKLLKVLCGGKKKGKHVDVPARGQ